MFRILFNVGITHLGFHFTFKEKSFEEQCKRNKDEKKVSFESITIHNSEIHTAAFAINFLIPAPSSLYQQLCTTGL